MKRPTLVHFLAIMTEESLNVKASMTIKENIITQATPKGFAREVAQGIIKGIENVKGENINIIDFTKLENVDFKYFIICDCQSNIQVNAISNSVKKTSPSIKWMFSY